MRKLVLAGLATLAIGTAAFASPAEARCWWNGYSWHCGNSHNAWRYRHHYWGPHYGHYYHHYRDHRYGYGYGSAYGPRWHSGWGY